MRLILLYSVCNALWTDNMRQHDEAGRVTILNLAVGMWEAARTNRIFTNGFATQGEMYIMAVEVPRYTRFVHNMPEWPSPREPA
jgi:hypothetical protein